jgi:phenylacetate-CoA ligase
MDSRRSAGKKNHRRYWNPLVETLSRERLQQLQLRKFRRIFEWAHQNSKFHRKLYENAGLVPGDIKTFEDIRSVPKVEKAMIQEIQGRNPFPYGDALCVPLSEVTEYHQTSGTTSVPVYQPDTWQDWEWWSESWGYILCAHGYRDTDRVFVPFGYNIFVAFWAGHYAAEKLGCEVIPGGVLNTEARILKMQELKATAMMATPTYVLGMADVARRKLSLNPAKDLCVQKITCAGEPGASIPSTKGRIEEAWGAKLYDHVGATEVGAWAYECQVQRGLHVNEAFFLVELEDPETGEIIEEPGKTGKVVITAFDRMAQPCIRFDTKDVTAWLEYGCDCGRTFRRCRGVVGRADDIAKVKGVLLAPSAIEDVVRSLPELGDEFEVIVTRVGDLDDITLRVELIPGSEEKREPVRAKLIDQLRLKTNLGYNLEFHPHGSLPRHEVKAKRFKDLRKIG